MNRHPRFNITISLALVILAITIFFLQPAIGAKALSGYIVNTVSDHNDGGCDAADCTLREAVLAANAHPNGSAPDQIGFNIPAGCDAVSKVCTLTFQTLLPAITDPVVIDGYTQPGASANTLAANWGWDARLLIELSGQTNFIYNKTGLTLTSGGSTVRGLLFSNFIDYGLLIQGSGAAGNRVQGNRFTSNTGLKIDNAPATRISGTRPEERNIFSANVYRAMVIAGSGAAGSIVQGNEITNSGGAGLGTNGALLISGAPGTLVGGLEPGAGNLISGNRYMAIEIDGSSAAGAILQGNYIGVDRTGTTDLPFTSYDSGNDGVLINGAPGIVIGGTDPGARNLIADGVQITGSGADGTVVQGNYIGVDVTGTTGFDGGGLEIRTANNLVGGTAPGARNLISTSIDIIGSGATYNRIQGNYVGTTAASTARIGSGSINISGPNNTVGGTEAGARNLIAGGVGIQTTAATGNIIEGNYMGTDITGTHNFADSDYGGGGGVYISGGSNNLIGGTVPAARNVICNGLYLSTAPGNVIQGNFIGIDSTGTTWQGCQSGGIHLYDSPGTQIGGTASGAGNLISGDIQITGSDQGLSGGGNVIQGNLIGTDATGTHLPSTMSQGDSGSGIYINGSDNNLIGGTEPGARNLIAGKRAEGIYLFGENNTVQGNYIGTDITGTVGLGNATGLVVHGSNNVIGGTTPQARNLISGNSGVGILLDSSISNSNSVQSNYIGVDASGAAAIGNMIGVYLENGASNNLIGGTAPEARNVISGNRQYGVLLGDYDTTANLIQGNFIGPDAAGAAVLGNGFDTQYPYLFSGVMVDASGNTIGGTTPGAGNIITGSKGFGVEISGNGNLVQGNTIGSGGAGPADPGNRSGGVKIGSWSQNNLVGGTTAGAGNRISGNQKMGVAIIDAKRNPMLSNTIANNAGLGIDLNGDGVTPNDPGDADNTANRQLQNFPVLTTVRDGALSGALNSTANTTFRIEFYASAKCDTSGYGEGEQWLGALDDIKTDGSGNAAFTFPVTPMAQRPYFTATATNSATGDTSEFSACLYDNITSLSLELAASANPVAAGTGFDLVLTVTNQGPSPADGIILDGSLPAGLAFQPSADDSQPCILNGPKFSCDLGSLDSHASSVITLHLTALRDAAGDYLISAQINSPTPGLRQDLLVTVEPRNFINLPLVKR